MIEKIKKHANILKQLSDLEEDHVQINEYISEMSSLISNYLNIFKLSNNSTNTVNMALLLLSKLFPDKFFLKRISKNCEEGKLLFSDEQETEHKNPLYTAVGALVRYILHYSDNSSIQNGANLVDKYLDSQGYYGDYLE